MNIAIKRINECIKSNSTILNLNSLGLTELPIHLPDSLTVLYLQNNQLTELPTHLPDSLTKLYISNNKLTELHPKLWNKKDIIFCNPGICLEKVSDFFSSGQLL